MRSLRQNQIRAVEIRKQLKSTQGVHTAAKHHCLQKKKKKTEKYDNKAYTMTSVFNNKGDDHVSVSHKY